MILFFHAIKTQPQNTTVAPSITTHNLSRLLAVDVAAGHLAKLFYGSVGGDCLKMHGHLQRQISEPGIHLDFDRMVRQLESDEAL